MLALSLIAGKASGGWEPLEPLPEPNGFFACGVAGRRIVVIGGTNWKEGKKHWLDVIWSSDPATGTWQAHGKFPHPLAYAVAAEWKDQLIIAGGTDGQQPLREVWAVKPSLEFKQIGQLKDDAILAAHGVMGNHLLILGGCADPAKLTGIRRNGVCFNLADGTIQPLAPPGEVAFCLAAGVVQGRELFTFAGTRPDPAHEFANLNDSWAWHTTKRVWRPLGPYPFGARGASAVDLDGHRILIAGGANESDQSSAAAYVYDTRRNTYTATTPLPVAGLVGMVRVGDYVYCLGGEDRGGHRMAECFKIKAAELVRAPRAKH